MLGDQGGSDVGINMLTLHDVLNFLDTLFLIKLLAIPPLKQLDMLITLREGDKAMKCFL